MYEDVSHLFRDGLHQLGLIDQENREYTNDILLSKFLRYQQELLEWNAKFNLTAITDPEEVQLKHFLDSLSLLQVYDRSQTHLLDIGSGAGFPGLPLKIARPSWHITLLEATGKKASFLRHIIDVLQLKEIDVIHGRAEEVAHQKKYRSTFDIVTARAVASLSSLLEYSTPYCHINGIVVLPKKGDLTEELIQGKRAAIQVGAILKADQPVELPGLRDGRRLLVWEQIKPCPPQFPRSGSAMAKKPLG
jgi:16S rRNA (guanine527-N7)-methyltransferase